MQPDCGLARGAGNYILVDPVLNYFAVPSWQRWPACVETAEHDWLIQNTSVDQQNLDLLLLFRYWAESELVALTFLHLSYSAGVLGRQAGLHMHSYCKHYSDYLVP